MTSNDAAQRRVLNETYAQVRFSSVNVSSGKQQRFEMQGVAHWELRAP